MLSSSACFHQLGCFGCLSETHHVWMNCMGVSWISISPIDLPSSHVMPLFVQSVNDWRAAFTLMSENERRAIYELSFVYYGFDPVRALSRGLLKYLEPHMTTSGNGMTKYLKSPHHRQLLQARQLHLIYCASITQWSNCTSNAVRCPATPPKSSCC